MASGKVQPKKGVLKLPYGLCTENANYDLNAFLRRGYSFAISTNVRLLYHVDFESTMIVKFMFISVENTPTSFR